MTTAKPHKKALTQMRERGGKWAAFESQDLGHPSMGHLQFIKYGPGCTHEAAPERCPDTENGLGWRYVRIGFVDLTTGTIVPTEPA